MYSEGFYDTLQQILGFFTKEKAEGYVFANAIDQRVIKEVNELLISKAQAKGKKLKVCFPHLETDQPVMEQIRNAATDADGLIISNLDELILKNEGDILTHLNYSRESLQALHKPLLFWIAEHNLPQLSNRAPDLFSQRALPTFLIDERAIANHKSPALTQRYKDLEYKSKEEFQALELRIKLLEKQLKEAEEEGISKKRIADELALPLAEEYCRFAIFIEALKLVEKYKDFASATPDNLKVIGDVYRKTNNWEEALHFYKIGVQNSKGKNGSNLSVFYAEQASIFYGQGKIEEAIKLTLTAIKLLEGLENIDKANLAILYNNLSVSYSKIGNIEEAIKYAKKSVSLEKELNDDELGLATAYCNLANIYHEIGKVDLAMQLHKDALQIREKVLDKDHPDLAHSYNNMAWLLSDLNQNAEAIKYSQKAIDILNGSFPDDYPDLVNARQSLQQIQAKQKTSQ